MVNCCTDAQILDSMIQSKLQKVFFIRFLRTQIVCRKVSSMQEVSLLQVFVSEP